MYYEINEELCKRGHEQNHLITDYKPGSTTASYRAAVDAFAAKCEAAKQGCRPGHEAKLDALADRYARRLAAYYNNSAANNARHVCVWVYIVTHRTTCSVSAVRPVSRYANISIWDI